MTTSTVEFDSNSVIPSATDVPSVTDLGGAASDSVVGNYSADSVIVSDSLTSGGSSLSVDTYAPITSAPTDGSSNPFGGSTDGSSNPFGGSASGSSNPISGSADVSSNPISGGADVSSNPISGSADVSSNPISGGAGSNPISGGASGSSNPISGGASGSSNPISGGASGSSNPFSASQGAGGFGGSNQGAGSLESIGLGTGTTNTFTSAANNPYAGGGGEAFASLGNVIVNDNQWVIGKEITPERFTKVINYTVEEMVDTVIGKLSNRLSESGIVTSSSGGNPFAGGNNPFGTTNAPALDYLKQAYGTNFAITQSASNFTTAVYSQTLPSGSSTSTAAGGTPVAGAIAGSSDGNPLVPSNNTSIAPGSVPQGSSLDILQVLFGEDLKGAGGGIGKSPSETLRIVQDDLLNFTKTVNSATGKKLFSSNNTPLKSGSDLLTLYKNDILSANTDINKVNELGGGSGDPYSNFTGSGSQAVQPPNDILSTVLGGLLPFSGTDNIFNTPEGGIPVGYGNKDFGSDNAVIGNANWNYGHSNVSVGNANWNWDSSKNNATIGNGNWHLDNTQNNRTIGNGNWYWESTSNNKTLGNGNWDFGNNNTTIGNGNWDFGSNNTVIGTGNRVFTSNSVVIGNGNWSVVIDKSNTAAGDFLGKLDNLVLSVGIKDAADNLVNSLFTKFADAFQPLTGDFSESTRNSYNQFYWDPTTV
ncbi:hypothetical protein [Scytonema sp. HK-05]|uniref:hypothetical protein n=1 Tax=Scytonema sp. HK-05 TaxID=1137095 RepID=UPI000936513C|nr:hypothetical protein [Scytonema sp. HK-05]OKH61028.1 hypothetical protein NIES2130_00680 [Scytonema sp. HK-05]